MASRHPAVLKTKPRKKNKNECIASIILGTRTGNMFPNYVSKQSSDNRVTED